MTDRNIPHLRDIFGFHGSWSNQQSRPSAVDDLNDQLRRTRLATSTATSAGNDSAISSIGSASEEEAVVVVSKTSSSSAASKKKKKRRENSKTLTEKDVKHLERHLSMKKTIRKKIMRDLQQAFVEDPNEFRVEDISHEQLKAEINIQSLSFGNANQKKTGTKKMAQDPSFLEMLRGGTASNSRGATCVDDEDSGHGSPTRELSGDRNADSDSDDNDHRDIRKNSFWSRFTIKGRNKR